MLVNHFGLNVLALDQSDNNIQQSKSMEHKENKINNKVHSKSGNAIDQTKKGKYVAITTQLTTQTKLEDIVFLAMKESEQFKESCGEEEQRYLLTGLHCCGGLSCFIIRMFREHAINVNNNGNSNKQNIGALALLSCCYHLVNERGETTNNSYDFPMSKFVTNSNIFLGHGGRLLACYGNFLVSSLLPLISFARYSGGQMAHYSRAMQEIRTPTCIPCCITSIIGKIQPGSTTNNKLNKK